MKKDKLIITISLLSALLIGCAFKEEKEDVLDVNKINDDTRVIEVHSNYETDKEDKLTSIKWIKPTSDNIIYEIDDFDLMLNEKLKYGSFLEDEDVKSKIDMIKDYFGDDKILTNLDYLTNRDNCILLYNEDFSKRAYFSHDDESSKTFYFNYYVNNNPLYESVEYSYFYSYGVTNIPVLKEVTKRYVDEYKERFNAYGIEKNSYEVVYSSDKEVSKKLLLDRKGEEDKGWFSISLNGLDSDKPTLRLAAREVDVTIGLTNEEVKKIENSFDDSYVNGRLSSYVLDNMELLNSFVSLIPMDNESSYYAVESLNNLLSTYKEDSIKLVK